MPEERPASEFYKALLENLHDGVYFVDKHRRITYWNRGAAKISGYPPEEVVGRCCPENILAHCTQEGVGLCFGACPVAQTLLDGADHEADIFLQHKDGHRVPVWVRVSPLRDANGEVVGAVEIFTDNSAKMAALERAESSEQLALIDALTGMVNRRALERRLVQEIGGLDRDGVIFSLLFLDMDHFKKINDDLGHEAGDVVLQTVSRTLESNRRSADLIGRWGGDEFCAILPRAGIAEAQHVAERFRALVASSQASWNGTPIPASISVGVTAARPGDTPDTLVARADQLMYRSKRAGRNRVTVDDGITTREEPRAGDNRDAAWPSPRRSR